jgi:hypothetical protein
MEVLVQNDVLGNPEIKYRWWTKRGKNKRNKLIKYGEWVQRLGKGWEYTH